MESHNNILFHLFLLLLRTSTILFYSARSATHPRHPQASRIRNPHMPHHSNEPKWWQQYKNPFRDFFPRLIRQRLHFILIKLTNLLPIVSIELHKWELKKLIQMLRTMFKCCTRMLQWSLYSVLLHAVLRFRSITPRVRDSAMGETRLATSQNVPTHFDFILFRVSQRNANKWNQNWLQNRIRRGGELY